MQTAPLSYQQRETIENVKRHPGTARRYDGLSLFRLTGDPDIDALTAALADLAAHHPALRTVIKDEQQLVYAAGDLDPVTLDHGGGTVAELGQSLLDSRYQLDEVLSGQPLFRAGIHRRESQWLLSIRLHHLVFDGWSLEVLWRDLSRCYTARAAGRRPVLPPQPVDYAEFMRRQEAAHVERFGDAVAFYRDVIGGCDGAIRWPAPAVPYLGQPTDVDALEMPVPPELTPRITELSRQAKVTPFVVLMSATAAAISRVTGAADVLAGVDTANRDDPALRELIGFVVNTRVARLATGAHETLLDLIRATRQHWMRSADYGDVYYDRVLAALDSPHLVKINMPSLGAREPVQGPDFPGVAVREVPLHVPLLTWRDVAVFWSPGDGRYHATLYHRLAAVSPATAGEFRDAILDVLATGRVGR